MKSTDEDTLRAQYPAELIKAGERGKFADRYQQGTNIVVIDPELHRLFPSAGQVNRALRQYAQEHGIAGAP